MASNSSTPSISGLLKAVASKFDSSVQTKDVLFFPSTVSAIPISNQNPSVKWQIRNVPALLNKNKAKAVAEKEGEGNESKKGDEQGGDDKKQQQNKDDVFAPPYVDGLLVRELGEHVVLLNKYSVLPRHFLLITRQFESQNLPPSPTTLALSFKIIHSFSHSSNASFRSGENSELFGFYNCGPLSGASQKHRHLQFVQVGGEKWDEDGNLMEGDDGEENDEDDDDEEEEGKVGVPIDELLKRIEKDGKEHEHVHALPLPYQHFVVLISSQKFKKSSQETLEAYLASKLLSLLDSMFRARLALAELKGDLNQSQAGGRSGPPSFNLILTKRALHLIPRNQEEVGIPGLEGDGLGRLSVNAMGFAGFLLTKTPEELTALKKVEGGIESLLAKAGLEPVPDFSVSSGHQGDTVVGGGGLEKVSEDKE